MSTMSTQEAIEQLGGQIGGTVRALAILVASLHNAGVIDGNAIASRIRLDSQKLGGSAREIELEVADLIRRQIEAGTKMPKGL